MKMRIAWLLIVACVLGLAGCSGKLIEGSEVTYQGIVTDRGMSVVNEGDRQGRAYITISTAEDKALCFWLGMKCETSANIGDNVIIESAMEERTNLRTAVRITVDNTTTEPTKDLSQVPGGVVHIVDIWDDTQREQIDCVQKEEKFYEDAIAEYYFPVTKSQHVKVMNSIGQIVDVVTALETGRITIEDLDAYGIEYDTKRKSE